MNSLRQLTTLVIGFLVLILVLGSGPLAQAATTELFFSEYIEGTSNNKALEIYNDTGAAINLATSGYNVQMFFNGSASAGLTISLTGTVANGDVYVLAQSSANATILAQADQTNGSGWFNGDDAVVLRKGTTIIDVIGQIGLDPGTEWGTGLTSTADNTLRRKATSCVGDANGGDAFDPVMEWDGFATDTFDGLGSHTANCGGDAAPTVTSTTPSNGATNVALDADIQINFSENVNVTGTWFTIDCDTSGSHTATVSGGPQNFILNPDADFAGSESCTVTIFAANVADQDATDPPDNMEADVSFSFSTVVLNACEQPFTPIYAIQGNGPTAAITGTVTTQGVVVGDYEGSSPTLRGFYLQDLTGDADNATSDGSFVFNGNNDNVSLGQVVRVTGTAGEFQDQTQISSSSIIDCSSPATVAPVEVTLPFPSATFLEQYEGMLVRLPQTLYVTEHFQLGRFGQVVVSSGERLQQPTHIYEPGSDADALQAANNLNRLIVDDALNNQNPDPILFGRNGTPLSASNTLRGGDTVTGIVGILTYTWAGNAASGNAYRVRPINALDGAINFVEANSRPSSPEDIGGTVKVAGMNLLNFFNTFDGLPDNVDNCTNGVGGAAADCRGADTQNEFDRQWPKTVEAVVGTGADVIGVIEIENDGYGSDSAIQFLVDKLNDETGSGTYAFIDVDAATGQTNALGTDAIKVGLVYKPASVTPIGTTAALNTEAFVNGGDSAPRSRPSLAQAFQQPNGATFVVDVNHLKSKGSACDDPDAGDGQGNCNTVRTNAANELVAWLASDPTGTGEPDVLIIGDLNAYAKEDPVAAIEDGGYTNLIASSLGSEAYSFVFDGQWGYLDHALSSANLVAQVTGVTEWHINADEPSVLDYNTDFKSAGQITSLYSPDQFRVADHDPVLVGLDLNAPPDCSTASPSKDSLWPANHKFTSINVLGVTDPEGDTVTITIDTIFQDEPVDAPGNSDGKTSPDGQGVGTSTAKVRAERDEALNGRVYHLGFTADDGHSNSCSGEVLVGVPKSKGGSPAVDEGALFDSTAP